MYLKKEALKITSDLIRFHSTKDNRSERKKVIDYVEKYFEGSDVYIRRFERKGIYSIVINLRKEKNPYLFLNGHLDVVPADEKDFIPKVKGNRLYGRGSGDMKAGVAVMMMVMKELAQQEKRLSIGLMLTTDEEIGGENGVGYLVKNKKYRARCVVVPDGGTDLNEIVINEKGILHLKVIARGKGAHGSRPFLGENAIEKLVEIYKKIQKVIPPIRKGEWKASLNLGKIEGGKSANVVPDFATMYLDIRFTRRSDRNRLFSRVQKIAGRENVEILTEGEPFIQSISSHFIKLYLKSAEDVLGNSLKLANAEGASDARFFSSKGIPTVITKIYCKNIHGDNEWVSISQMEILYMILMHLLKKE